MELRYPHAGNSTLTVGSQKSQTYFRNISHTSLPRFNKLQDTRDNSKPHVQACATLLEEQGLVLLEACCLLNRAGWYLRERGRYAQAAVLLQLGLTFYEQLADETAPGLGSLLNNLALLYQALGQYAQMTAYA